MDSIPNNKTGVPLEHYRKALASMSPKSIADRCRIVWNDDSFALTLLGQTVQVSYPEGIAVYADSHEVLGDAATILLLRYLTEGTSMESTGTYLAYAEIPWGSTYLQQFTGRCIKRLAFTFGSNLAGFTQACESLGATKIEGGDFAFEVPFMENLTVRLILWEPDEEFAPSAQILFSDNFLTAFTAEDLAYVMDITIDCLKSRAS